MRPSPRLAPIVIATLLAACGGVDSAGHGGFGDTGDHPTLPWAEFRSMTYREPGTGVFIYDGDTMVPDEKALRLVWEQHFAGPQNGLIVHQAGGADAKWDERQKKQLTYCVSTTFGSRYAESKADMKAAAEAWEAVADVDFHHLEAEDANCNASNPNVLFDVSPAGYASYLARAFFPNYDRSQRNVLIADGAFGRSDIPLVGVLRHELGHVLGFRHEHTRPESGTCFEDSNWRALTPYDSASVMHYPQCNGTNSWQLPITADDAAGAANLYGAAGGGTQPTPGNPDEPTNPDEPSDRTPTFTGSLEAGKRATHGPIAVVGGRTLELALEAGTGAKMYIRFGARPTTRTHDSFVKAGESLVRTVPNNRRVAYVLVVAGSATEYDVFATMSQPSEPTQPTQPTAPKSQTFTGTVSRGQAADHGPVAVRAGQRLTVALDGSGDPDLKVAFNGKVGSGTLACSSNASGADRCSVTVPEGSSTAWIEVYGYSDSSYTAVATVD